MIVHLIYMIIGFVYILHEKRNATFHWRSRWLEWNLCLYNIPNTISLVMACHIGDCSVRWPRRAINCYFHLEILQWNVAMEMRNGSAQLNNYYSTILITLSHFAPGPLGFRYIDTCIGRLASARVFNLAR